MGEDVPTAGYANTKNANRPPANIQAEAQDIISSLQGQNVRNWNPDQIAEAVRRIIEGSKGRVDENMARGILQSAMGR